MDLSSFSVVVKRGNSHRFQYEIEVEYKDRKWSRYRTFSEFENLQQDLIESDFCDIPLLPDINFAAGLAALEDLHNAENLLDIFLKELFSRPDTRCSRHLLEFVDLIHYLEEVPEPPKAKLVSSTPSSTLAVSDCVVLENDCLLVVAYEEKTFLSKLGKIWSFIELDVLGGLKIFKYDEFDYKFVEKTNLSFTHKVRCICYDEGTRNLIMGTDSGDVERYRLIVDDSKIELEFLESFKLHEDAILSITLYNNHYYTSGYDCNIRKVNLKTNRVVGGGKLSKRLKGEKLMTSTVAEDVMFIATTSNELLSYYMNREIPVHISTTRVVEPCNIRKILPSGKNLFVSHGNTISCYSLNKVQVDLSGKATTKRIESDEIELSTISHKGSSKTNNGDFNVFVRVPSGNRCAQFSPGDRESALFSSQIYHMVNRPKNKQVIAAHDEIISIWCTGSGKMLYAWTAHKDEQVHFLYLLEQGDLLLSGGSDGQIKLWSLPEDDKLVLWTPPKP